MGAVAHAPSPGSSPLTRQVDGRTELLCPKCETWQDVLAYKNPNVVRKYARSLNAIMKCVICKHVFSPRWLNDES